MSKSTTRAASPRIIKLDDVMARTGLTRTLVFRGSKAGTFPRQIKIGPRAAGWLESEVDAWIEARVAARDEAAKAGGAK